MTPTDITALVDSMTLAEKAGQMAQVEKNSITPDQVSEFAVGSVLSGGGGNPDPNTPQRWNEMVGEYLRAGHRSRLGIPLIYGSDAVHGHSNVVGATIFPHNIGLGASGDADLVERVYRATARELVATGVRWDFAPTVAVALDPRWGRTYEAFGDDTGLVSEMGAAAVRGLQEPDHDEARAVLACAKHFVGDGGTAWESVERVEWTDWWDGWGDQWRIDQGDARIDEADLREVHLPPYQAAIAAGALSVMVSYSSWNGDRLHAHRRLLTDVLKGELNFGGFVVSDWLGLGQIDADPYLATVRGITAGIDMVMVPFDYQRFIADVVRAVEVGDIEQSRIDDAVARILKVKEALGLFDLDPAIPESAESVGSAEHRALARFAAASTAVVLSDPAGVLPIEGGTVLIAGTAADDIGLQCGGWTIEWQGSSGPITAGTSILDGLRSADIPLDVHYRADGDFDEAMTAPIGIAVVAEPPYAEGLGDRADLALSEPDVQLVHQLRKRVERLVLVVLSGRPILLGEVSDMCDTIVAAWLPGSEGAGVADILTGAVPVSARLPRRWPQTESHVADPRGDWDTPWPRGHGVAS